MSGKGTTCRSEAWKVDVEEDKYSGDGIPVQLQNNDYKPLEYNSLGPPRDGTEWWQEQASEKTNRPPKLIFTILDPRDDKKKFVAQLDPSNLRSHRVRMVVQWLKWEMQYEEFENSKKDKARMVTSPT